MANLQNYFK